MKSQDVERDERTVAVENVGYRWSYRVLSFGVLLLVAYRGFVRHEQTWDLIGLVVISGAVSVLYQGWRRTLYRRWIVMTFICLGLAGLLAGGIMLAGGLR